MPDEDQTCESFLVAGAVFCEVGLSLLVAGAACREIEWASAQVPPTPL